MEMEIMGNQNSHDKGDVKIGDEYLVFFIKIMAVGFIGIVIFIIVFSTSKSNEYPDLTYKDSIDDIVWEVEKNRGSVDITFESKKKYHINSSQNFNYKDYPSLAEVLEIGDVVLKKSFSDTITVQHSKKNYIFLIGQTIK